MPRVKSTRRRPPVPLPDRPGRWRMRLRRQRRLIRPAVLLLALAAVVIGGLNLMQNVGRGQLLAERLGQATARLGLRVHSVVVEGRQKTPEPLLRAALGVSAGDPMLSYSLDSARARVETIRWVQSATIARQLPDTILVRLVERRPFAVWQQSGRFMLIDRDGEVVTDSEVATFAHELPLVVGAGAPPVAAKLIDALAARPDINAHLVAAVRVGERRWNLRMTNGADVMLPEGGEDAALARLAELQADHGLLDRPLRAIDLRLPDRLVVRALPQPDADPQVIRPDRAADARRPT